jgi:hypothetical protein
MLSIVEAYGTFFLENDLARIFLVTSIEERALQSEGNRPVPWSSLQTEFPERTPGKNLNAEPRPKTALKLFISVPSLFQAHPSTDTVSYVFLSP